MSDTAIFIAATSSDLNSTNGLPGDLKSLRSLVDEDERIVHTELLLDSPAPTSFLNSLHNADVQINILPSTGDPDAALIGGLIARLSEFVTAYPQINQFILAGINVDRLTSAASFLQRSGFNVILCGPRRNRLDASRSATDNTEVWGSIGGSSSRRGSRSERPPRQDRTERSDRNERSDRGDRSERSERTERSSPPDPFEVLVEEVSKSRKRGHRVLLTSLKQRMRKRIRRFDETKLKDKDGRPMRKFKDFIVDAANRGLIQLIENGNASHVLMPGEAADADADDDDTEDTRGANGENDEGVDPLLDTVDTVSDENGDAADSEEEEPDSEEPQEAREEEPLSVDMIDPDEIDEEAKPPPKTFLELLEKLLEKPLTLAELVQALEKKRADGQIKLKTRTLRDRLQAAFNNELLENAQDDKPPRYSLVDDWKEIFDYL